MTENIKFSPHESLTYDTVTEELERFKLLLKAQSVSQILLDLSAVKTCDSAGLAFLIEVKRLCEAACAQLNIKEIPETVYALAAFSCIDEVLRGD